MQQKRDTPDFKKSAQDDVLSMQTGIVGYKGAIHYHCAQCIDGFLATLDRDMCEKMVSYSVMSFIIVSARSVKSLFPKYESGNFLSLLAISILEFALSQ